MTQAQKIAKYKFKKAIEYRTKTGVSLKEAFAHIYGKKVSSVKKKVAPKKKAAAKKVTTKKALPKKVGALPIDFKGNFLGYRFKVLNQYQLDGGVTAQLVEIDGRGDIIAELSGSPKENDRAAAVLYSGGLATGKDVYLDDKDKKDLQKRIKSFVVGLNKEIAAYNSGKDTSKKKSKGLKIVYKPETKKMAVVDQIKSILKSNKKILKGGYTLKTGVIREKKVAGIEIGGLNTKIMSGVQKVDQDIVFWSKKLDDAKNEIKYLQNKNVVVLNKSRMISNLKNYHIPKILEIIKGYKAQKKQLAKNIL